MIRTILGFALLAVVVWLALKLVLGVMGTLIGLLFTVLWLAVMGYVLYVIVRVISPPTAARLREIITGRPSNSS